MMATDAAPAELSRGARYAVLAAAFTGLVFDGIELGLMPVASLSVTKSLLGERFTAADLYLASQLFKTPVWQAAMALPC